MSVDQIDDRSPALASDLDRMLEAVRVGDISSQPVGGQLPRVVVTRGSADTVEALLLAVGRGDQEAFVALCSRMAGLVRVNVRRVLRDASRSDAVTQEIFAEVLEGAIHLDPDRDSAQTWLLTRTHQRAMDGLRSVDATDDLAPSGSTSPHQAAAVTQYEMPETRRWSLWSARGAPSSQRREDPS